MKHDDDETPIWKVAPADIPPYPETRASRARVLRHLNLFLCQVKHAIAVADEVIFDDDSEITDLITTFDVISLCASKAAAGVDWEFEIGDVDFEARERDLDRSFQGDEDEDESTDEDDEDDEEYTIETAGASVIIGREIRQVEFPTEEEARTAAADTKAWFSETVRSGLIYQIKHSILEHLGDKDIVAVSDFSSLSPEEYARVKPDEPDMNLAHQALLNLIHIDVLEAVGSTVVEVPFDVDRYFDWLGDRPNTEEARGEFIGLCYQP